MAWIRTVWARRELLLMLASRTLRIRYQGSALGFFWTLLGPIALIVVYWIFLSLLKTPIRLEGLIAGILAWHFLSMCMGDGLFAIVGNVSLVTKAAFPRMLLPLAMVLANLLNFLLSLLVLGLFLLAFGVGFGPLYWVVPALVTQLALCIGVVMIVATSNVFFRDTEHLMGIVTLAWFFLSPVVYTVDLVLDPRFPQAIHILFFANPMTGILCVYRHGLLGDPLPGASLVALSFAVAWAIFGLGVAIFQANERRFGDEL
jgi:lipopolysaccharide transport system permease protein